MDRSMDFNQGTLLSLCVVILLLYFLYRAKKKKLIEEEQKYIQKFLIKDDIPLYRPASPLKISGFLGTRANFLGDSHSPKSNRNTAVRTKISPAKKLNTVDLGRDSPTLEGKSLSPTSKIFSFEIKKIKGVSESSSPIRKSHKSSSEPPLIMTGGTLLQQIEHNKVLGDSPTRNSKDLRFIPLTLPSQIERVLQKKAKENNQAQGINKDSSQDASMASKKRGICFSDDEDGQEELKKESQIESTSLIQNEKKEFLQYETILDSSFESGEDDDETTQTETNPINKRQLLESSRIDLADLAKYGMSSSLKKYVANKTVQEEMREKPTNPNKFVYTNPIVGQKPATAAFTTGTQPAVGTQGTQSSTTQSGSIFGKTSTLSTNTGTGANVSTTQNATQSKGIFGGNTTTGTTNAAGQNATQSKPLFGGTTATTSGATTTQNTTQSGSIFGGAGTSANTAGASTTGATTTQTANTQNATQSKPLFGATTGLSTSDANKSAGTGGLFSGTTQQSSTSKPLFGNRAPSTGNTTGGLFGNQAQGGNNATQGQKSTGQLNTGEKTGGLFSSLTKPQGSNTGVTSGLFANKGRQAQETDAGDKEEGGQVVKKRC